MSRKQWSKESMAAALQNVREGMNVREAARLYNLPFETLRRRVVEKVPLECRSGPPTVLTQLEEDELASYCVRMADMGFGLSRNDVMAVAFKIAEASGRKHPFSDGAAGRAWFDGFRARHPKLTLRCTQSLSHARASSTTHEVIADFFGKLAAVCAKLNLLAKPMQIWNMDETGVTVVHKPGKVVTEVGRRNVWAVTSGEKGKTHTILSCVSASGSALPPFMIYPRKRVSDNLKAGAVAGTTFHCSDTGWVNSELFLEWLQFFVQSIPPARPVLLLLDGHASHVSIEAVEFARSNEVHMLCLPAHTTHVLQPLDVGVFKAFKSAYNKACKRLMADHPHRVITTDQIAGLVATAWPQSLTPVNIMSGFKKCGIYPLNPGEVTDRQIAPSTLFSTASSDTLPVAKPDSISERDSLYKMRYDEGYDIYDDDYLRWIRENKLELPTKSSSSEVNSTSSKEVSSHTVETSSVCSTHCGGSTESSLSEILVIPKPVAPKKKRQAVNSKASCITDSPVLRELKHRKEEKEAKEMEKRTKMLEREQKKKEREKKKKEQEEKKKEREKQKKEQEKQKERGERQASKRQAKATCRGKKVEATTARVTRSKSGSVKALAGLVSNLDINETDSEETDGSESEAECPGCGLIYGSVDDSEKWVQCDVCGAWWDLSCACIEEESIAEVRFVCDNC